MQRKALLFVIPKVNRGAFCQFPFRWIYFYDSNKSTRKEIGKTHLCAVGQNNFENKIPWIKMANLKKYVKIFEKNYRCSCRCRSWAQGERSPFLNCCCHLTTFQIDPPNCSSWNSVWKKNKKKSWNDWHLAYSSAHSFRWQDFLNFDEVTVFDNDMSK